MIMRKFFYFFLSLTIILPTMHIAAAAGNSYITVDYSLSDIAVSVGGKTSQAENTAVSVIAALGTDAPSQGGEILAADCVYTNADGAFAAKLLLPAGLESGKYTVYADTADEHLSGTFMLVYENSIAALLPKIKACKTAAELERILDENTDALGIDTQDYTDVSKGKISEILFAQLKLTDYTAEQFSACCKKSVAAYELGAAQDTDAVLRKRASELGLDISAEYDVLTDAEKKEYLSLLAGADFTSGEACRRVKELRVLACVKNAGTWGALKYAVLGTKADGTVYIDNFAVLAPDTTNYDRLTDKDRVFMSMFSHRTEIGSFEGIRTSFAKYSLEQYNAEHSDSSKTPTSGGGGGGGSTGTVGGGSYTPPAQQTSFSDIAEHWARERITKMCDAKIVSGYEDGTFRPDNNITRAEFVQMFANAFPLGAAEGAHFDDVAPGAWYYTTVSNASAAGYVSGVSDNLFMPERNITRQDAVVILYRYISGRKTMPAAELSFADGDEIAAYAKDAVGACVAAGIISGMGDNSFAPYAETTRAQAITMLANAMEYAAREGE